MSSPAKNALLLVGGGARAAYQTGVLRSLARAFPQLEFPILTGISAGAINAASLANSTDGFAAAVERTAGYWRDITIDQVFDTDFGTSLDKVKWVLRMATAHELPPFKGMLDTAPLRRFLCRSLDAPDGILHGIETNLRRGRLSAFGVVTAQYPTARTTTWVQGKGIEPWARATQCGKCSSALTVDHIMASTALPLAFPAVQLEDGWHGDGGLRLTSPLSASVHLGADRVLAISTLQAPGRVGSPRVTSLYPQLGSVLTVLLDSVFLDVLDSDAAKMHRINQLIADNPRRGEFGLRPMDVFVLRPSVDIGALAHEYIGELPKIMRRVLKVLGGEDNNSAVAATLLFQPAYTQRLIEIGERDGEARRDELATFFGFKSKTGVTDSTPPAFKINGANGHAHTVEQFPTLDRPLATERTGTD